MHRRSLESACVVAIALGLALALTYPLVLGLDRSQRLDSGDNQHGLWNVAWVAHALTTEPSRLFDANIFYPHRRTLAYSESNIAAGALATPVYWLTGNPYLAFNFVLLIGGFVGAAGCTYALVRHLTGSRGAAAFAGVSYAFCPFIFARLPHIQLQLSFGIPLALLAVHRLVAAFDESAAAPTRTQIVRSVALGLVLFAEALSCAYYGIFAGLAVGVAVLFYSWTRSLWRRGAWWLNVGVAAATAMVLVLPFFLPYLEVQQAGFARPLDESREYSANIQSWFVSSSYAHRWMLPWLDPWKEVLFPGFLTVGLGLCGIWVGLRATAGAPAAQSAAPPIRETTALYALIFVAAFWLSFGPDAGLYTVLFHTIPVFSFLRAPARVGIVVQLALAVLAGIAIARLSAGWRSRTRGAAAAALVALLVLEFNTTPIGYRPAPPLETAYTVLARQPFGVLAVFPFYEKRSDYPRHGYYMLQSMFHWRPMINGYSDHIPADFRQISDVLWRFPSYDGFAVLKKYRARYVLFHARSPFYGYRQMLRVKGDVERYHEYLKPLHVGEDSWLYEIVKWPE